MDPDNGAARQHDDDRRPAAACNTPRQTTALAECVNISLETGRSEWPAPLFCFPPELPSDLERVDPHIVPPGGFIASLVQVTMMPSAKRYRVLISDLSAQSPRLRETQVMCVTGLGVAEKAWLRRHEAQMFFIAYPLRLRKCEGALLDPLAQFRALGRNLLRCRAVIMAVGLRQVRPISDGICCRVRRRLSIMVRGERGAIASWLIVLLSRVALWLGPVVA